MAAEIITITMKWRLKKKMSYITFPAFIQKETERAIAISSDSYAGWIPKKVIVKRKSM